MMCSNPFAWVSWICAPSRFSPEAEAYHGDDGLADLLARPDVDAVLVALAAQGMLEVGGCFSHCQVVASL